jgi:glucosamine-6-phosphate deaminase
MAFQVDYGPLRSHQSLITSNLAYTNPLLTQILDTPDQAANAAALEAAGLIRTALATQAMARVVASTGVSQFEFLKHLIAAAAIDWNRVDLFHLDEYIGLPGDHPASFQRYIRERIVEPTGIEWVHYLDGMADPVEVCASVGQALAQAPVDVCFAGVGENGHLAFNDPPADFETEAPFLIVDLDERGRRQQVGEGWFRSLEEVPRRAVTMSVRQILKARAIVGIATGLRKAEAVRECFEGEIGPAAPASALRLHANATVYLDREAASLMSQDRGAEGDRR